MRLKLAFVYSLFLCPLAFSTTVVTGHIARLDTTTPGATAYVRFWLRGLRGNQPRITGTGAIAPQFSGSTFYVDLPADASGNVSGTIYSTRDSGGTGAGDIEAGGSYTAVYYGMQIFNSGIAGPEIPVHARSGGTLDIANVSAVSTLPVVTAPNGDTTYARIDGGNTPFTGAIQAPKVNSVIYVGSTYTNIAAAVTAAGSSQTLIVIPSTYSGTECPAATTATITFWDLRGGSETCTQNSVSWNQTSGSGLHSMARFVQTRTSPSSTDTGVYSQSFYTGTLPANQTISGGACEADTTGAVTVGANLTMEGCETDFVLNSTGGTIPSLWANLTAGGSAIGNTTNVTNFANYRAAAYTKAGSETVTNAYGLYLDQQTAGSVRNFSFYSLGAGLFSSDAVGSGINFEDGSLVARPVLTALHATNQMRFRPLLDSAGYDFSDRASATDWLVLSSAGISIPTLKLTIGAGVVNDGGGFKHIRSVAGCATAASAGATCDTTVTWATAFADANYTVTCGGNGTTSGVPTGGGWNSKLAASVKFRTVAATAAAAQFTNVECVAVHD